MNRAINLAKQALLLGEVPVGAIIVHRFSKEIVAEGHNLMQKEKNPLLHAEINVIYEACRKINSKYLSDYDIYVSLEPCHMCAAAISFARLSRLYYGASDIKQGAIEHGSRYYNSGFCFHRPEVYANLNEQISLSLIRNFFSNVRKNSL